MLNITRQFMCTRHESICFYVYMLLFSCLTCILFSCESENISEITKAPLPFSDELISVNFTVSETGMGKNDITVHKSSVGTASPTPSKGGESSPFGGVREGFSSSFGGVKGGTVVIPIAEDLFMHATLREEEAPVKTRASLVASHSKVRVIAYSYSDLDADYTTMEGHADYEVTASGMLTPLGANLSLPASNAYRFVAYSFHDATALAAFADTTANITAKDVLWGEVIETITSANPVHIRLNHLFAKVKMEASLGTGVGFHIDNITGASVSTYAPALVVATGEPVIDPPVPFMGTVPFVWSSTASAPTWTSEERFVFTEGECPFVELSGVTIDGTVHSGFHRVNYTSFALETGKEYTLSVRFHKGGVREFAPRITWDSSTGKYALTTDPTDAGLYFKYGSVAGIFSGAGAIRTLTTPPIAPVATFNATNDVPWKPVAISTWATIPYANANVTINAAYHTVANVKAGKGDPCRLVGLNLGDIVTHPTPVIDNGEWRLPTWNESIDFIAGYSWERVLGIDGGIFIPSGDPIRSILPAALMRDGSGVASNLVEGHYWLNTAGGATLGYSLDFTGSGSSNATRTQSYGLPIRCVYDPQFYVNVVPVNYNAHQSYLLDGSTYTLDVRSGSAWRIKRITGESRDIYGTVTPHPYAMLNMQPTDNLTNPGLSGGPNPTGEAITFTVVNNKALWGSMSVTFESPAGLFNDYTVTLIFALPKVKILGVGSSSTNGYNVAANATNYNARRMLDIQTNFGIPTSSNPNPTVYSRGFDFVMRTSHPSQTQFDSDNPDIVFLSYNSSVNQTQANMYTSFLNNGGVVIACLENNGIDLLLRTVTGDNAITVNFPSIPNGVVWPITPAVNDEITNGPFGDLRDLQWGDDYQNLNYINNLPLNDITLYTPATNKLGTYSYPGGVIMFKYNPLPFFFVGDGGFIAGSSNNASNLHPFKLNGSPAFAPVPKPNYGNTTPRFDVYNSQLFGNIITWAITQTK